MGKKMKVEHNIRDTSHHAANSKKGKPAKQQKAKPKAQPEASSSSSSAAAADNTSADILPLTHQQRLLSSFASAFQPVLASPAFATILQEVKAALYARDFDAAFTSAKAESLDAYAARWSPTRSLAYAVVLLGIAEHLEGLEVQVKKAEDEAGAQPVAEGAEVAEVAEGLGKLIVEDKTGDTPGDLNSSSTDDQDAVPPTPAPPAAEDDAVTPPPTSEPSETTTNPKTQIKKEIKILSIGGGAAELAALAAYLSQQPPYLKGTITLLDAAPWNPVVSKLHAALTVPPPVSRYANEAQATAAALVEPAARLSSSFAQLDALAMTREELSNTLGGTDPVLVTLLFTLNELYTAAGIGKTTAFLLNLTATVPLGSLLLVVDSPGSYSEAAVGKESKKYPMQWLMDHTLVNKPEKDGVFPGCRWEKVESNDSVWFRLADSLNYPISLENMRYQMHLYRATKP